MKRLYIQIAITAIATIALLIHQLWPIVTIDSITLTLLLAAFVPWLAELFKSVKAGGIEIEFQALRSDVKAIRVALTGIVTKHEIVHLRQLTKRSPYRVQYGEPLWRDLEALDAKGFLKPTQGGLDTIKMEFGHDSLDPNRPSFNLDEYVAITPAGDEYVRLYDSVATKA